MISARTKAALEAAKARGVALGGHREGALPLDARERGRRRSIATRQKNAARHNAAVLAAIRELNPAVELSLEKIAAYLNARGIRTAQDTQWDRKKVWRMLRLKPS
jgi:DNA invertase Pin-like site-specific DNA recombinase